MVVNISLLCEIQKYVRIKHLAIFFLLSDADEGQLTFLNFLTAQAHLLH